MHVLLIHQAFAAPGEPGGTRHYELARRLVASGHRVTIITSAINYLTATTCGTHSDPVPDGLRIIRVAGMKSLHRGYLARGLTFFAFGVSALWAAWRLKDVDLVWGTSPPLVQLVPAWLTSLRCPGGLVFEERDLWPEFAIGMGIVRNGILARLALAFKRFIYTQARRVVINSPGFRPFLVRYGVAENNIHLVPNGADAAAFDPETRDETIRRQWDAQDRFVILYAGALGRANGLDQVLLAGELLRDTPTLFVLVGDGNVRAELVQEAQARHLDNIRFMPAQPKSAMPRIISAADACLATLRDIPLFRTTYPNKVFDYMAGGRAVILGIDGVIRELVESAGAGVFVEPGNGRALADAVRAMMERPEETLAMGRRGRATVCARFDRRFQAEQVEALFAQVLDEAERSRPILSRLAKRVLDIVVAATLLVVLSPVLLAVAAAVRVGVGSPILFRQRRAGLRGRSFTLYKFRTMRPGRPDESDEARLERVGGVLRSLSLDELPQLWNVLRGDMSLVGPRPLLPAYLDRYTAEQARRHEVRPGITGLAQVSGRNALSWPEKFALDVWYVDHHNLRLDAWILWRTMLAVVLRKGVSAPGRATMPEFLGNGQEVAPVAAPLGASPPAACSSSQDSLQVPE